MYGDPVGTDPAPARAVLMAAFHYPPCHGSSGIQRTLSLGRFLPRHGWKPVVLTAAVRAYPATSDDLLDQEAPATAVVRAPAWDTARHLSLFGRYPHWLARPDRWASWIVPAVAQGLWQCRKYRVDVLWSTFPIASAHAIALALKRLTGLPWIADFRDPMWEGDYPRHPSLRRSARQIEKRAVEGADRVVLTTEGARELFEMRYPAVPRDRFIVIENGYDEERFSGLTKATDRRPEKLVPVRLVHSGTLYPSERDPSFFFQSLAEMRTAGLLDASSLRVILRGTGHDREIAALVAQHGIVDLVSLEPSVGYSQALQEMVDADVLLLLQADNCDRQVPAKLYEYLRAGRPILALVGQRGDTARAIRDVGWALTAPLDDPAKIGAALRRILEGNWLSQTRVDWDYVRRFDRREQVGRLAVLLNDLAITPTAISSGHGSIL